MQYVLSKEEMDEQRRITGVLALLPSVEKLQEFCSFVSDKLVLTSGWAKGRAWGCILTSSPRNYCDDCPAKEVCPHPYKQWSK